MIADKKRFITYDNISELLRYKLQDDLKKYKYSSKCITYKLTDEELQKYKSSGGN